MRFLYSREHPGFTLIELLIVVAIIAILAAIAVPNFLEAQTRAKVSRAAADMRSMRTAIESYAVDHNRYPETDFGTFNIFQPGAGPLRLTTPISYITSIFRSPFKEENMGGGNKIANVIPTYLYVRRDPARDGAGNVHPETPDNSPVNGADDNHDLDRAVYIAQGVSGPALTAARAGGAWLLKSVGPDNVDNRNTMGNFARVYDATNGTISAGDLVVFSDKAGFQI